MARVSNFYRYGTDILAGEQWLVHTLGQVTAVVVGFNEALGVVGIDVKGVEVCADGLDRGEVLGRRRSVIET